MYRILSILFLATTLISCGGGSGGPVLLNPSVSSSLGNLGNGSEVMVSSGLVHTAQNTSSVISLYTNSSNTNDYIATFEFIVKSTKPISQKDDQITSPLPIIVSTPNPCKFDFANKQTKCVLTVKTPDGTHNGEYQVLVNYTDKDGKKPLRPFTVKVTGDPSLTLTFDSKDIIIGGPGTKATVSGGRANSKVNFIVFESNIVKLSATECTLNNQGMCVIGVDSVNVGSTLIGITAPKHISGLARIIVSKPQNPRKLVLFPYESGGHINVPTKGTEFRHDSTQVIPMALLNDQPESGVVINLTSDSPAIFTVEPSTCTTDATGKCPFATIKTSVESIGAFSSVTVTANNYDKLIKPLLTRNLRTGFGMVIADIKLNDDNPNNLVMFEAMDSNGNPIAGVKPTFGSIPDIVNFKPANTCTTDANGQCSVTIIGKALGVTTIYAKTEAAVVAFARNTTTVRQ